MSEYASMVQRGTERWKDSNIIAQRDTLQNDIDTY